MRKFYEEFSDTTFNDGVATFCSRCMQNPYTYTVYLSKSWRSL